MHETYYITTAANALLKLFAILMINIHLFNIAGYHFVFDYYIHQSDNEIISRLDSDDFSATDIFEVKIKLNLPYISTSGEYQRMDGEYELNGIFYKYVKKKVSNDTLYLLCLKDYNKMELLKGKTEYTFKANDLPSKNGNSYSLKKTACINDYTFQQNTFDAIFFKSFIRGIETIVSAKLTSVFIASDCPPPDVSAFA